jgi:hypothetical protein
MQRWEYAELLWGGRDRGAVRMVTFTHRAERWEPLDRGACLETVRRLGDEGWEMVSAVGDIDTSYAGSML